MFANTSLYATLYDIKNNTNTIMDDKLRQEQMMNLLQNPKWDIARISHNTSYLDDKYEVKWLVNNTYQVERNGECVYQGSESDCNEWLKCQLGYCG